MRRYALLGALGAIALVVLYGVLGPAGDGRETRIAKARTEPWFFRRAEPPALPAPGKTGGGESNLEPLEVAGTVLDVLTAEPVSGAEVRLLYGSTVLDVAWADEGGRFRFPPADGFDRLAAKAERYAVGIAQISPANCETVEIRLSPAVAISGRVVDEAGKPIAGAWVVVSDSTGESWPLPQSSRILADGAGEFRITDGPTGSLLLEAGADGFGRAEKQLGMFGPGRTIEGLVITLGPGSAITGVVRAGGEPVAGALVQVRVDGKPLVFFDTWTAGDGSYRVAGVFSGTGTVTARSVAHGFATTEVNIGTTEARVDVELLEGLGLSGRVTAQDGGKPVAGATVEFRAYCAPSIPLPPSMAAAMKSVAGRSVQGSTSGRETTGADGRFKIRTALCGPLKDLEVSKDGYQPHLQENVGLPANLEIELAKGAVLDGMLVEHDGSLVEDVRGTVRIVDSRWNWSLAEVRRGRFHAEGLGEGEVTASFTHPERGNVQQKITLEKGGTTTVRLVLPGTARLAGRVVSAGKGIAGATVGAGRTWNDQVSLDASWKTRTGVDGRFSLAVPAGIGSMVVYHPEFRSVTRAGLTSVAGETVDLGDVEMTAGRGLPVVFLKATLGATMFPREEGRIRVSYVWPRSGADRAGFVSGDEIVSIDGTDMKGATVETVDAKAAGDAWSIAKVVLRRGTGPETAFDVVRIPQEKNARLTDDGTLLTYDDFPPVP